MPLGRITAATSRKPAAPAAAARRSDSPAGSVSAQTPSANARQTASGPSGMSLVRRSLTVTTPSRRTSEALSIAAAISLRAPWRPSSPLQIPDGGQTPPDRDADPARALDPGGRPRAPADTQRRNDEHDEHHAIRRDRADRPGRHPAARGGNHGRWQEVPGRSRPRRRSVHAAGPVPPSERDRDPRVWPGRVRNGRYAGSVRAAAERPGNVRDPLRRIRQAGGADRGGAAHGEEEEADEKGL